MRIELNWHDIALIVARLIGTGVALVHGILTQRTMVRPLAKSEITIRRRRNLMDCAETHTVQHIQLDPRRQLLDRNEEKEGTLW